MPFIFVFLIILIIQETEGKGRLLLVGAGGLGLWAVQLSKVMYGEDRIQVIVADIDQSKLDLANTYGADDTLLWKPDNMEANAEATIGKGKPHGVIDFCGSDVTLNSALKALAPYGAIIMVGLMGGTIPVGGLRMIFDSMTIAGSKTMNKQQLQEVVNLVAKHNISYPSIQFCKLEEAYDSIMKLKQGKILGRAVIKYDPASKV